MNYQKKGFLHRFARDTQGGIVIIMAVAIIVLIAIAGAAVDFGIKGLVKGKMQAASDLAATSAAAYSGSQTREAMGDRYYALNFRAPYTTMGGATTSNPQVTHVNNGLVTVDPDMRNLQTNFIKLAGTPTLKADAKSVVTAGGGAADLDMAVVVDLQAAAMSCLNSPGRINTCSSSNMSDNTSKRLITAEIMALSKLADKLIQPNNANPNVRLGILGVGSRIRTAYGLTSNKTQIDPLVANPPMHANETYFPVTYINGGYDLVHIGIYAAQKMLQGGMGVPNAVFQQEKAKKPKIDFCQGGFEYDQVDTTPYAPSAQTARSSPGDANNISKNKYVMYFHAGDTIAKNANGKKNAWDPERCDKYASIWWNPDPYDPYVAEVCPNHKAWNGPGPWSPSTTQCPQVLVTACDRIKANPSGTKVIVVDFVAGDATGSGTVQAMSMNAYNGELQQLNWNGSYGAHNFRTDTIPALKACASPSLGGAPLPASIQPDPTKEYYIVSDDASLDQIMSSVAKKALSIRIIE